uniref:Uncharacterized protein MANES_18G108800 n=1 Tax=Rhizophora mucronata TaxID=61149 RepID=A0A2P2KVX9_RHIMU
MSYLTVETYFCLHSMLPFFISRECGHLLQIISMVLSSLGLQICCNI